MPKIDGIYHYGPDTDPELLKIAGKLENCPHLTEYQECQCCPHFTVCDDIFTRMTGRAVRHGSLRPVDITFYRQQFLEGVGIIL